VTLNVPDTTGYAVPEEFGALFKFLIANTPGADKACWSVHCHNDLGMAVANSLAAVRNGARQVECTVNGIGERAGNTSLEEVVMALHTREPFFHLRTNVVTEQIYPSSRLLAQVTGLTVPANKPVVGANAFAHEAGIHQDGVLKDKKTYEIMTPESVGISSNKLVLGKHSGRHAFVQRLRDLGVELHDVDMNKAFARFKVLADLKKNVYDDDLVAIVTEETVRTPDRYELIELRVTSSSASLPHATVCLRVGEDQRVGEGDGDGMVDACYKVISQICNIHPKLERYAVKAVTGGTDALGEVSCLVSDEGVTATGQGAHTDIIQASALAYVNALNKLEARRTRYQGSPGEEGP
jgi:2-isopropylmalate synthase